MSEDYTEILEHVRPRNEYQLWVLKEMRKLKNEVSIGHDSNSCHSFCIHIILRMALHPYDIEDIIPIIESKKGPLRQLKTDNPQFGDLVLVKPSKKEITEESEDYFKYKDKKAWHSGIYIKKEKDKEYIFCLTNNGSRQFYKIETIEEIKKYYDNKCKIRYYNMN